MGIRKRPPRLIPYDGNLIFVSNATEREFITHNVPKQCKTRHRYDQYTILRLILDEPNVKETAEPLPLCAKGPGRRSDYSVRT
jgi:hypothetical protein